MRPVVRNPALCLGVALLFAPGCKRLAKELLASGEKASAPTEGAAAGTEVSFSRSKGLLLESGVKLNVTDADTDARGTSVGLSVERGPQKVYNMLPQRVLVERRSA